MSDGFSYDVHIIPDAGRGDLTVFTSGTAKKWQPTTQPGALNPVALAGPRGAVQTFQIIVRAPPSGLSGVTAIPTDLVDGSGHTLAGSFVTLFREHFVDFTSTDEVVTGRLPVPSQSPTRDPRVVDPLIPLIDPYTGEPCGQPFAVSANENQPLFVDVQVPPGTPAGTYQGAIAVSDATGQVAVQLSVEVWDLGLPDMNVLTTHFDLNLNSMFEFHKVHIDCSGGNCWDNPFDATTHTIHKRYEELLHSHRIDSGPVDRHDNAPGTQCTLADSDWADWDREISPYMDGSYWGDGVPSGRIDTPFVPGADWGMATSCTQAQYTQMSAQWAAHLIQRGWFDRAVVYAADEPDNQGTIDAIATNGRWMLNGNADWKTRIMDTTVPSHAELLDAVGIFTVVPYEIDRATWASLFARGYRLWVYEGNSVTPPNPTFAINTLDGLEPTMYMWGTWYEGGTGFLYYATTNWDMKHVWNDTNNHFGKGGDGLLVYPGNHDGHSAPAGSPSDVAIDGPVPSYRLKMIRQGLQDYALLALAKQKGLEASARAQVETVYTKFDSWISDEDKLQAARRAIAKAILEN